MLKVGKRMTWDDIVKQYPDRWVAFSSFNGWGPDVDDGIIEIVLTDEEYPDYRVSHAKDGWFYKRTTDNVDSGSFVSFMSSEYGGCTVI